MGENLAQIGVDLDGNLTDSEVKQLEKKAESIKSAEQSVKKETLNKLEKDYKVKENMLLKLKGTKSLTSEEIGLIQLYCKIKNKQIDTVKIDGLDSNELIKLIKMVLLQEGIEFDGTDFNTGIHSDTDDSKKHGAAQIDANKSSSQFLIEKYQPSELIPCSVLNTEEFVQSFIKSLEINTNSVQLTLDKKALISQIIKNLSGSDTAGFTKTELNNLFSGLSFRESTQILKMQSAFVSRFVSNKDFIGLKSYLKDLSLITDISVECRKTPNNKYVKLGCKVDEYEYTDTSSTKQVVRNYEAIYNTSYPFLLGICNSGDQLSENDKNVLAKQEVFALLASMMPQKSTNCDLSVYNAIDVDVTKLPKDKTDIYEYVKEISLQQSDVFLKFSKLMNLLKGDKKVLTDFYIAGIKGFMGKDISQDFITFVTNNFDSWKNNYMEFMNSQSVKYLDELLMSTKSGDKTVIKKAISSITDYKFSISILNRMNKDFTNNMINDLLKTTNLNQEDKQEIIEFFNYTTHAKANFEAQLVAKRKESLLQVDQDGIMKFFHQSLENNAFSNLSQLDKENLKKSFAKNSAFYKDCFMNALERADDAIRNNVISPDIYPQNLLYWFQYEIGKQNNVKGMNLDPKEQNFANVVLQYYSTDKDGMQQFRSFLQTANLIGFKNDSLKSKLEAANLLIPLLPKQLHQDRDSNLIIDILIEKGSKDKLSFQEVELSLNVTKINKQLAILTRNYQTDKSKVTNPILQQNAEIAKNLSLELNKLLDSQEYKNSTIDQKSSMMNVFLTKNSKLLSSLGIDGRKSYKDKQPNIESFLRSVYSNQECMQVLSVKDKSQENNNQTAEKISQTYESDKFKTNFHNYDYFSKIDFEKKDFLYDKDKEQVEGKKSKILEKSGDKVVIGSNDTKGLQLTKSAGSSEKFLEKGITIPSKFNWRDDRGYFEVQNPFYEEGLSGSEKTITGNLDIEFKGEFVRQFLIGMGFDINSIEMLEDDIVKRIGYDFGSSLNKESFDSYFAGLFKQTERFVGKLLHEGLQKDLDKLNDNNLSDYRIKKELKRLDRKMLEEFAFDVSNVKSIKNIINILNQNIEKFDSFDVFFNVRNRFDLTSVPYGYSKDIDFAGNYFENELKKTIIGKNNSKI